MRTPALAESVDLTEVIACPHCDALHRVGTLLSGERARCTCCRALLIYPGEKSISQVIALSVAVAILMLGAVFFPFLGIAAAGLHRSSSVLDVALAFSGGVLGPLSVSVILLIVIIPLARAVAVIYALWPLAQGRKAYVHAARALRLAEALRPWSMAEIFIVGTAVALVKIAGLAAISVGPAFWAFCVMVIIVALSDNFMCKWTIWKTLEKQSNS